jgi:hypothetical protein
VGQFASPAARSKILRLTRFGRLRRVELETLSNSLSKNVESRLQKEKEKNESELQVTFPSFLDLRQLTLAFIIFPIACCISGFIPGNQFP